MRRRLRVEDREQVLYANWLEYHSMSRPANVGGMKEVPMSKMEALYTQEMEYQVQDLHSTVSEIHARIKQLRSHLDSLQDMLIQEMRQSNLIGIELSKIEALTRHIDHENNRCNPPEDVA